MTKRLKIMFCFLLIGTAASLTPAAKADEWDKRTVMTFTGPVEIPGQVLSAGTYVFKLADSDSDRTIVQIFTADEKQILATIIAIPDYRLDPSDKTLVTFEERAEGSPQAMHSWFYPGDNYGIEFIYPKSVEPVRAHENPTLVAAVPAPEPKAEAPAPEPSQPAPVVVREEVREEETVVVVAEAVPAPEPPAPPAELPKTAGNFALYPLLGFVLLTGGIATRRFVTRQS